MCRTRTGTLSLRALTSLTPPAFPPWPFGQGFLMSPARPSLTLNRGDTTVESLGLSAPQGKGETCRRKEGGEEGEFKQACLIDDSVFSSPVRAVCFETVSCHTTLI